MTKPYLGFGLGLRTKHYEDIVAEKPDNIDWFEIISENFMVEGGKPLYYLDKIRANYPMVMHGVSLSIGGNHPVDYDYLTRLKALINRVEPVWVSDHLAWTRNNAHNLHDLLPLPYTEQSLNYIVNRIDEVQNFLGRPLVIENPSSYVTFTQSTMHEYDFLNQLCQQTDCRLLLDVNNIYVSCQNHGWDADNYIKNIKAEYVWQHHLAGHTYNQSGQIIIDTHDQLICSAVWQLYEKTCQQLGKVSTMIERDDNIPPLNELIDELNHARQIQAQALENRN